MTFYRKAYHTGRPTLRFQRLPITCMLQSPESVLEVEGRLPNVGLSIKYAERILYRQTFSGTFGRTRVFSKTCFTYRSPREKKRFGTSSMHVITKRRLFDEVEGTRGGYPPYHSCASTPLARMNVYTRVHRVCTRVYIPTPHTVFFVSALLKKKFSSSMKIF